MNADDGIDDCAAPLQRRRGKPWVAPGRGRDKGGTSGMHAVLTTKLSSPQFRVAQQVKLAALNLICSLPDDILIYLFRFLEVPQIISLRKTSRKLQDISRLRIIWVNALTDRILPPCYPFPLDFPLDNVSSSVLESSVRRAYLLGKQWFSEKPFSCDVLYDFDATKGTPITDVRFIPGYDGTWIITVSKSIWSVMTVWELRGTSRSATKRFEWSQRDSLLQSFVLNDEGAAEATLAIAVVREGHSYIDIMSLSTDSGFHSLTIVESTLSPVYLHGDIIVLSNSSDSTLVMNWKTGQSALLVSSSHATATGLSLNNKCIQILFTAEAILVVRARGLTIFQILTRFIDPSSPSSRPHPSERNALHILIRPEADDPWATHTDYELQLFTLHPDSPSPSPSSSHFPPPYTSLPILTASVSTIRGALRYGDLHFAVTL
ncbi:hypothetical protein R3P38DRAFT_3347422 [Favolaschia claudopus]|uniref:F-box domain-containing protein n=1 Tax=Favolaschia claudopus TaxID=2862362 RepID=A0AAW0D3C4_9AGAR